MAQLTTPVKGIMQKTDSTGVLAAVNISLWSVVRSVMTTCSALACVPPMSMHFTWQCYPVNHVLQLVNPSRLLRFTSCLWNICSVFCQPMSQHWIYINSPAYRRFVEASKENRWLLWGAALALGGVGWAAASTVSNLTNRDYEAEGYKSKNEELSKLPMHSQVGCQSIDSRRRSNPELQKVVMLPSSADLPVDVTAVGGQEEQRAAQSHAARHTVW